MLIGQEGVLNKRLLNGYYGQGVLLRAQRSIPVGTPQAQRKVELERVLESVRLASDDEACLL
jgi:hypothetical protein